MTWTDDAHGTQTAVIGTEHTLDTPTTNATYEIHVDLSNMVNGDVVEVRVYRATKTSGTNLQTWKECAAHIPINPGCQSPPIPMPYGGKFTLKQTAGTGRNFDWEVSRV